MQTPNTTNTHPYEGQFTQDNHSSSTKGTGFSTGMLVGGLIGAAAALLFAPKTGKEMRDSLVSQSSNLMDKTMQVKDEAMLHAQLGAMDAKDKVSNMSTTASSAVTSLKEKAGNLSISAKQKLQEAKSQTSANEGSDPMNTAGSVPDTSSPYSSAANAQATKQG
ncbi:YtxH domain-containing protein [Fictibacillus iocasae]|uniref:YtxH domain-containing protein n=1 Tax=Fictibacillus iocasae TaxID=2715437 RepID=A0ABW2NRN3_9BACL